MPPFVFNIDPKQQLRLNKIFSLYRQGEIEQSQVIEKILDIVVLKK